MESRWGWQGGCECGQVEVASVGVEWRQQGWCTCEVEGSAVVLGW